MHHEHENRDHHHRHSVWHHLRPNTYGRFMGWLVILAILMIGYFTWLSMQPNADERYLMNNCEKSQFADGNHEVLWKCPRVKL